MTFGVRELAPALPEASLLAWARREACRIADLATTNDRMLPEICSHGLQHCSLRRQQAAAEGRVGNPKREQAPALQTEKSCMTRETSWTCFFYSDFVRNESSRSRAP